jgi:hypothetical protein
MLANNPVNLTDPSGLMPNLPTAPFGNGGLLYPPQPGAPQYDLTGRADGLRGLVDAANQLSRALSQGARPLRSGSPECGPTGVLGDWWQSLQRGTLGPDLLRWGLNEYRTNPLWQRQFTEAELRQLTIDLAKRGEFEITKLLHQIVDEKGLQHWLTGQVDYAVQALRDPRTAIVMGFNLGVGLVATGIGAATLPAIAAVAVGSLVANVAFQTWVESGGGLNFNLEAFRSSLGINSAATVPGLIGGMIGARFGPWGRYIGAAIGSGLSQILTNKLMGRDWDEGLLLNMGLSVGMEGVMAGVEHVAGRLENVNFGQKLREWGLADERLYAVEPSSRRLFDLFGKPSDGPGAQRTPSEFPDDYEIVGPGGAHQGGLPTEESRKVIIDLGSGSKGEWARELQRMNPDARVIATEAGDVFLLLEHNLRGSPVEVAKNWTSLRSGMGDEVWAVAPNPTNRTAEVEAAVRLTKPGGEINVVIRQREMPRGVSDLVNHLNELTKGQATVRITTFEEIGIPISNAPAYWDPSDPAWHIRLQVPKS